MLLGENGLKWKHAEFFKILSLENSDMDRYFTIDMGLNVARWNATDVNNLVHEAYKKGVSTGVVLSHHPNDWDTLLESDHPHFTLGVSPRHAQTLNGPNMTKLQAILEKGDSRILALSTGLNFTRPKPRDNQTDQDIDRIMKARKAQQISAFKKILGFARVYELKLYLTLDPSQETFDTTLNVMTEIGLADRKDRGAIYAFRGNSQHARTFIKAGFKLIITGALYNKHRNAGMIEAIKHPEVLLTDLMVASNTPYDPVWIPSRQSEPPKESTPAVTANIVHRLARILGRGEIEVGDIIHKISEQFLD